MFNSACILNRSAVSRSRGMVSARFVINLVFRKRKTLILSLVCTVSLPVTDEVWAEGSDTLRIT